MKNNKQEISSQIANAFDFLQKLYDESSYLIKEIEGQLSRDEHEFTIMRPSGYSISARSSTGLDQANVNLWLLRKFAVGFVENEKTKIVKGVNVTKIDNDLKVLYIRIILNNTKNTKPELIFGVFHDIKIKNDKITKFEQIMAGLEYSDHKVFSKFPNVDYEDGKYSFKGRLGKINLLDIETSEDLVRLVIKPVINIYNSLA